MHVKILFSAASSGLSLVVADDGVGFVQSAEDEGQGLPSMRRRAQMMGGRLYVETGVGRGTTYNKASLEITLASSAVCLKGILMSQHLSARRVLSILIFSRQCGAGLFGSGGALVPFASVRGSAVLSPGG
jgi:hypothetical protein